VYELILRLSLDEETHYTREDEAGIALYALIRADLTKRVKMTDIWPHSFYKRPSSRLNYDNKNSTHFYAHHNCDEDASDTDARAFEIVNRPHRNDSS